MAEKSLYYDVIKNLKQRLMLQVLEEKKGLPDYSFLERLREEYSIDGTFEVLIGSKRTVRADIVSMDSSAPLKSRPTLRAEYGKVPKILQGRRMEESDIKKANVLRMKFGADSDRLRDVVLNDAVANVDGILDTLQEIFLKGLSDGVVAVGADNVGLTEVRIDYGFKADQKFGVPVLWTSATATPLKDIRNIIAKARQVGKRLTEMHLDPMTFDRLMNSAEVAQVFNNVDVYLTDNRLIEFLRTELGINVNLITRTVNYEIDGVVTNKPVWTEGMVTFTQSGELGTVFYTDTAEHDARSECSLYAEPNAYILSSMWRDVNPIREQSNAQCMALPVITDVENIYQLDTKTIQA